MKHLKSLYWISTGLVAVFMVMAAIPDVFALLLVSASYLSHRTVLASARRSGSLAAVARPSLTSDSFESGESY